MSYLTQATLEGDPILARRIFACAAAEGIPDPMYWVQEHMWRFSTQDGWVDAYTQSVSDNPGADEEAITDAMVLSAVQAVRADEPVSPPDNEN